MKYDAIIIGAGAAGLVSALKLSNQGKRVLVIEKQPVPGGLATTFRRDGFFFESSLHCVNGLAQGGELRQMLEELDVGQGLDFIELKNFILMIYPGHELATDFNLEHFISSLKSTFAHEAAPLERLFNELRRFYAQFDRFSDSGLPLWLNMLSLPLLSPLVIKMSCLTAEQLIKKYIHDEALIALLTDIWRFIGLPPSRLCALYFLVVFRIYNYEPTAYIKGGYNNLFKAMVEKIRANGSEVKFSTAASSIITDSRQRVQAVETEKGERFFAKVVISNASSWSTLTELIDSEKMRILYRNKLSDLEKSVSAVQVYLGLDCPAKDLGMRYPFYSLNTVYNQDENWGFIEKRNFEKCPLFLVDHAQVDPSMAGQHKGTLLIMALDTYAAWPDLSREAYRQEKDRLAHLLIGRAQQYLPELKKHIQLYEVATPLTFARYGSSPEGAIYGLAQTMPQSGVNRTDHKTRVKGLLLAGAWTQPGAGVHGCFISGMQAAEIALRML